MSSPLRPTLVVMSWRGGPRFERCLESIGPAAHHFARVVLSVTSEPDSADMRAALAFAKDAPGVEAICTGRELPTMRHQAFWVDHLRRTGTTPRDWVYWLAYDDQVRRAGIEGLVGPRGDWPLRPGTAYFGPWAIRHEQAGHPYDGPWDEPLESWTSFPAAGPTRLTVADWVGRQLVQPTYMQMSGSVCQFACYERLHASRPPKKGPMRIEMAVAAAPPNTHVEEFPAPVSIIYGRPDSDRASYGAAARSEDVHLALWLARHAGRHPSAIGPLARAVGSVGVAYAGAALRRRPLPAEEWRVRGTVAP